MSTRSPVMLLIMDGFGVSEKTEGNAVAAANKPNLDRIFASYSHTTLPAHGEAVGLPPGQMGGSEVGHLNLGAGRTVYQDLTYINKLIEEGEFFKNKVLVEAMQNAVKHNSAVHLLGLLSDGGVHSHLGHVYALLDLARHYGVGQVYIHAFLDGRDVPPSSAQVYIAALEQRMGQIGIGKIATVSGRYYAMDRDARWDRTEKAYRALVLGEGQIARSAAQAVEMSYKEGVTDEFVLPTVIVDAEGRPFGIVKDHDSVIFFNFRADRARQLTRAFVDDEFTGFDRGYKPDVYYVCFMEYIEGLEVPTAFSVPAPEGILAEVLAENGKKQLHIAETEKFAHVTFFFNGGREEPFPGEDRVLIPSPKVATYDLKPEMSAREVADEAVRRIESGEYDFIVLNFANCDMVGHTGVFDAAVAAVETVDECVGKVVDAMLKQGGTVLLTADHGNAEQMIDDDTGGPYTAHSLNPVPFVVIKENYHPELRKDGTFADVAPTILGLMGIPKPQQMTGRSLIAK